MMFCQPDGYIERKLYDICMILINIHYIGLIKTFLRIYEDRYPSLKTE